MKGGAAVMIFLFKELADSLPYPLGLQLTTDEEIGGNDGAGYQVQKGIRGDFIITGENTNLYIRNTAKGRMLVKVTTTGKSAHAAYLWYGENAIIKMHHILARIHATYPTPSSETEKSTITISRIETDNTTYNKVPDHCALYLDIRYISTEKKHIIEALQTCLEKEGTLEIMSEKISPNTSPQNPYILALQKQATLVLKKSLPLKMAHGASDLTHYQSVGSEGIEFGPIGANAHADDEWVDIQSLEQYYQILKAFLLSLS
jgi:succinyl-diaminopimelate desuccinylase